VISGGGLACEALLALLGSRHRPLMVLGGGEVRRGGDAWRLDASGWQKQEKNARSKGGKVRGEVKRGGVYL
jgi:hypothetical protein